jgi:hypothetical protein
VHTKALSAYSSSDWTHFRKYYLAIALLAIHAKLSKKDAVSHRKTSGGYLGKLRDMTLHVLPRGATCSELGHLQGTKSRFVG